MSSAVSTEKIKPENEKNKDTKAVEASTSSGVDVTASVGSVHFNKYIEIFPQRALPKYNVGGNKAYEAVSTEHGDNHLVAIVCERHNIPRRLATTKYKMLNNPYLANLLAQGVVAWPLSGDERYVFLYVNNFGAPLLLPNQEAALGWRPDEAMEYFIRPFVSIFQDFKEKDLVHGAIRLTNVFSGFESNENNERPKKIVLGDCFSTPPSFSQPLLYESIERAMADPAGRGLGTRSDDLYAFGVCIAILLRGADPINGMKPENILKRKIEMGSYGTLIGKERIKGEILELLRGVLHDDPSQRWTIAEVLEWVDGKRLTPKQALVRRKAPRPFTFGEEKYYLLPMLAMALDENVTETRRIVEDETLLNWLQRSVDDDGGVENFLKALEFSRDGGTGAGYAEKLLANVSSALDPYGPLRYKGMRLTGDGFGSSLAESVAMGKDLAPYAEIISSGIMVTWLTFQQNKSIDIAGLFTKYEQCKRFIRSRRIGDGIERCLYLLNKETPCLSDAFSKSYVTTAEKMLKVYEGLSQKGKAPTLYVDRHVAAFLMEREPKVIEQSLYDLNSGEKHKIMLANLRVLSEIQVRFGVGRVPAVAKAFSSLGETICERFKDKELREKVSKEIQDAAKSGVLKKILDILDDDTVVNSDLNNFKLAFKEYETLRGEAVELDLALQDKESFGVETGRQWASIISCLLAAMVLVISVLAFVTSG
ncbi:MAG: hypothetical protein KTR28_07610 [Micavibrio sp.]|nr:hypothetical protein [Micavibrio sp.]